MPKITKRLVDVTEPQATNQLIWDDELKGFCLRVHTTGSKSYLLRYRVRGTQKQITIGHHGPMTPDEARRKAIKLLSEIKNGGDPAPTRGTPTVADVCARYLDEHVAVRNKASTGREAKQLVATRVLPTLGKMKIEAVTRQDIQRLHHELRHTKYEANRTLHCYRRCSISPSCGAFVPTTQIRAAMCNDTANSIANASSRTTR